MNVSLQSSLVWSILIFMFEEFTTSPIRIEEWRRSFIHLCLAYIAHFGLVWWSLSSFKSIPDKHCYSSDPSPPCQPHPKPFGQTPSLVYRLTSPRLFPRLWSESELPRTFLPATSACCLLASSGFNPLKNTRDAGWKVPFFWRSPCHLHLHWEPPTTIQVFLVVIKSLIVILDPVLQLLIAVLA